MESGRVRLEGTHTQILENPHIGELYLGGMMTGAGTS
jgi:ABC-type lipopolysaccharide export system ATPase subunit